MSLSTLFSQVCPLNPAAKPTFPLPLHGLVELLWILSLTVKPNPYRPLLFFFPIFIIVTWSLGCTRIRLDSSANELGVASRLITVLLFASAEILLSNPQRDVRYVESAQHKKTDDIFQVESSANSSDSPETRNRNGRAESCTRSPSHNISEAPFFTRLKWAATLYFNPRGVGYNHEPTSVIPAKPSRTTTRRAFITRRLQAIFVFYLLMDVARITVHIYEARRRWTIEHQGYMGHLDPWKLLALGHGLNVFAMLAYVHTWMSVAAVGLGLSRPCDWPYLNDLESIPSLFSLKVMWGRVWHQMFRRMFALHTDFIVHTVFRFPNSRSKIIRFTKVNLAFFISGLLHYGADAALFQTFSQTGGLRFYMLQAVGLMIEDFIINVWRFLFGDPVQPRTSGVDSPPLPGTGVDASKTHNGSANGLVKPPRIPKTSRKPRLIFRFLGYFWVFLWLGFTLPLWVDPLLDAGYNDDVSRGQYSILMGLWRGDWVWPEDNRWFWERLPL